MKQQSSRYALVFRQHTFGYEVQAIAKLFIPHVRFRICEDGILPEDAENYILTEIQSCSDISNISDISDISRNAGAMLILKTEILLHGRKEAASVTIPSQADAASQEYALCRLLYQELEKITGYTSPWGMLTGIRPVRKVLQALTSHTPEQACRYLQEKYFISDEKMQLAMAAALVQQPLLSHCPEEIGLYISIPFCPTRCSYCSFVSHSIHTPAARKLIPAYIEKLCEEIAALGEIIKDAGLSVQSVYIGGGTPTAISAAQLQQVMQAVADHIAMAHVREYTVEAGRADTITEEKLQVIRAMGATRISINPQTLQDAVLREVGRCHTAQQVKDAFHMARKIGFTDINMDLIAGLPTDTYAGFADTLEQVLALAPDSITVHTLTLKRSADLYQTSSAAAGTACTEHAACTEQMTSLSAALLPAHQYRPYYLYRQKNTVGNLENVGYARPGKENLYNIFIMDETQIILGAGCGASNKIVLPDGTITRIMNYKYPYEYIHRFDELMQKKSQIRKELEKLHTCSQADTGEFLRPCL